MIRDPKDLQRYSRRPSGPTTGWWHQSFILLAPPVWLFHPAFFPADPIVWRRESGLVSCTPSSAC